jgi:pimeloyl-ACP methyl ester carboxylesterase
VLVSSMKDAAASLAGPPPPVMTQPMLALMTRSPATPADQEAQIRQLAAQLDYRAFDGAGHYLMMERPDEVNDAIAGFILGRGLLQ